MTRLSETPFVETKEYRRFVEFCGACSRYRYIGLCYGPPGVGKTLSARHYANWDQIEAYIPYRGPGERVEVAEMVNRYTIVYTPTVINSPGRIQRDIALLRHRLVDLVMDALCQKLRNHEQAKVPKRAPVCEEELNSLFDRPSFSHVQDPTVLILIDEADRLKMSGFEQVREIFDESNIGLVLIGMPGLEKRLARYPQLYSRVGFVHRFPPLGETDIRRLLKEQWTPPGVTLPKEGVADEDALAAVLRITGGNFRLLHRLLTQIGRILEINKLETVTRRVVEAARESLVIGTT